VKVFQILIGTVSWRGRPEKKTWSKEKFTAPVVGFYSVGVLVFSTYSGIWYVRKWIVRIDSEIRQTHPDVVAIGYIENIE
jgi:hypothetical protein